MRDLKLLGILFNTLLLNMPLFSQSIINMEQSSVEIIITELENDSSINLNNFYINRYTQNEGALNLELMLYFERDSTITKQLSKDPFHSETDIEDPIELKIPDRFKKKLLDKRSKINISNRRNFNGKYYIRVSFPTAQFRGRHYVLIFNENGVYEKMNKSKWII